MGKAVEQLEVMSMLSLCEYVYTNLHILILLYEFVYSSLPFTFVGLDAMASKTKKASIIQKKYLKRKQSHKKKINDDPYARRCVTQRAPSADQTCPMRLCIFLTSENEWYLQTNSCLHHKHHPKLEEEAIALSQRDLSEQQQSLVNVLFGHQIPPTTISKVLSELNDDDKGTYLPKTLFNYNEKCRNLIDVANGILPTCSDAEKTIQKLEL